MRPLTAKKFFEALKAAGVVSEEDLIRRIVIDIQAPDLVVMYVERPGDERLLDVIPTLDGVEIRTGEPGVRCVNPDHLEPVTPRENLRRSPLTPTGMDDCAACGSVFTWNGHQRRCLKCQRVWRRQYARDYRRGLRRREAS